ncbi:MAG: alpha/beta hydrolase, partial [Candidatus Dormibacteraeota bacterium]|nr:alpha/beta hydrolase [Candidatus Dormibacteraeota bacterium]
RIYRPGPDANLPILVYFHGGGWVVGSLASHDGVARFLCRFAPCIVISVAYRLAPEHTFPTALEDAWLSTSWAVQCAIDAGWDANRLAVGGDSSGGNLATVVARRARDRALPLRLQLLVYPALDLWAPVGGPSDEYRYWVEAYLGPKGDANQPDVSPLRAADLRGVAAAVILSCGLDPLRKQADAYAQRLQEAGVPVKHHVFEGMIHGAFRMPAALEGARDMLATSAAALGRAFNLSR